MKRLTLLLTMAGIAACNAAQGTDNPDIGRWEQQARNVTITRDDWGIAHVHGKTDADAVFGMIYAQAEDDFNRVETNYINSMGRLAESEGEKEIWRDLRMKLFVDPDSMKAKYEASEPWLKSLMVAWADGLNFYLAKHPNVKPKVITHFEPWMALTFSEGSIGGDIERVSLRELEAFYGGKREEPKAISEAESGIPPEPTGSNGIAIAPSNTTNKHALLLINPHTSFFFRSELQVSSDEGLDAYGAVTWGQFFVYQGFNDRVGWMHTSSSVDNIDEYAESIVKRGDSLFYRYGKELRPVVSQTITVPYKSATGVAKKEFTVYRTHHGPIVRSADGKWISVRLMEEPVKALTQSYSRTKAKSYAEFRKVMDLHTNSSNNTIFASADGDIAYFHANFIPKRDPKLDWSKPVDGSNPATEWGALMSVEESPFVHNPTTGWVFNTNDWPYSAAGPDSPKEKSYPLYVDAGGENARGIHAIRVLDGRKDFTLGGLLSAAFDSYLTAFDVLLPPLVQAYDRTPAGNPVRAKLAEQIDSLRKWDRRWSATSAPTSLAVFWGDEITRRVRLDASEESMNVDTYIAERTTPAQLLDALAAASDSLTADFGSWKTPWGNINRFQRLNDDITPHFDDAGASIPVPFTSSRWGSLASFGARPYPNTKKWYGTSGNSFVAVVEFGDSVRARAVTAGGESGDPKSKHFNDQAERYATGNLRDVYFYPNQLKGHIERQYSPGN
ncbi:MAG TPA: acylase [Gemmatimonadaceae bacterium]|nr:acylase [Gemmatimonadaceae bacterium]